MMDSKRTSNRSGRKKGRASAPGRRARRRTHVSRAWRIWRGPVVILLACFVSFFILRTAVGSIVSNLFEPVNTHDATPIEVVIPSRSTAGTIARILYTCCGEDEPGLIHNTAVFKVYVDFLGKANNMKAGTYILSRNMTMKQIIDIICEGNPPRKTVQFTVPEGYSAEGIANVLLAKGLITDTAPFLKACMTGYGFENFGFVQSILDSGNGQDRKYVLEGYLFPDTYEVFADSTVDSIITRMLNRFHEVFSDEDAARAKELGFTIDQVITLASMIEREARLPEDFYRVSAVFHNRLKDHMSLQSCASLSYALGINKYTFSAAELAFDSRFNTYKYSGLPIGPISNPGRTAINAALYPDQEYLSGHYLYFCNGNPAVSSELLFSRTYEEHQANVEAYQQYWK